ncbi:MAG: antitoxin family protein [Pyrinomonadaceae bacterium]
MNTVEAIYENGVFRPTRPVDLDEGAIVEIIVEGEGTEDPADSIPDLAIDLGISDLSVNVDHYLYGLPKIENK